MPSFATFSDSAAIANSFKDAVVVYVEGESDVGLLRKLLPGREGDLSFKTPIDGRETGGCTAVIARVNLERPNNTKVFGILDRDALARECEWNAFYESDDDEFNLQFGGRDGVHILSRWEIENYLLEPAAVHRLLENWADWTDQRLEDTELELVGICLRLLPISAASGFLHERGQASISERAFCNEGDAADVEKKVRELIDRRFSAMPAGNLTFDEHYTRSKQFDPGEQVATAQRIAMLLRIVDGKRVIAWLQHKFRIEKDPRLQLADNVLTCGVISELDRIVGELLEA